MVTESRVVFDLLEYAGKQMQGKVEYWDALFDRQSSCSISKDNVDERIALPEVAGIQLEASRTANALRRWKAEWYQAKPLT